MTSRIIIAIDGYSSTGKSTFAKAIARELGYVYIDTGAMYRAVALFAMRGGCVSGDNAVDETALRRLLVDGSPVDISFRTSGPGGRSETWLDGENVEKEIRTLEISRIVSHVAALPFVREYVDRRLREIGAGKGVVMDGRDIGTAVFPDAELKIFMTARVEVRARRRYDEMLSKGGSPDYDEVLENLRQRDYIDSHRSASPLRKAADAFELDNSDMTMEEELAWVRGLVQGKFGILC